MDTYEKALTRCKKVVGQVNRAKPERDARGQDERERIEGDKASGIVYDGNKGKIFAN